MTVVALTNGTGEITRDFLHREGLDDVIDAASDVDPAGCGQPAPQAYRYVVDRDETSPQQAALVAAPPRAIHGAIQAGFSAGAGSTGRAAPPADPFASPMVEAGTFNATVEALLAR